MLWQWKMGYARTLGCDDKHATGNPIKYYHPFQAEKWSINLKNADFCDKMGSREVLF